MKMYEKLEMDSRVGTEFGDQIAVLGSQGETS